MDPAPADKRPSDLPYSICVEGDLTVIRLFQPLSLKMICNIYQVLSVDHLYLKRLWDLRKVDFHFSEQDLLHISKLGQRLFPLPSFSAAVVSDEYSYAVLRQFEVYAESRMNTQLCVFYTMEQAMDWLASCPSAM